MSDGHLLLLADMILVLHFLFAGYLTLGLPAIWIGRLLGKPFVHNPWFRYSHLGVMGFVLFETLIGVLCPLTIWEADLRRAAGHTAHDQGFVTHWVGEFLFWEAEPWIFTVLYALFFGAILLTLWLVPVHRTGNHPEKPASLSR